MTAPDADPIQNTRDFAALSALVYCQFGAILWDFATTFAFDWSIFTGKNPWAWPMVAYFTTRYGSFVAMIPLIMQVNAFDGLNCARLWVAIVVGIKLQKLGAEALFGIRAMAVFEYNRLVVSAVFVLWLTTAAFGFATIKSAVWTHDPATTAGMPGSCVPIQWQWELGVAYVLTLVYAFFVIGLVVFRLKQMGQRVRSSLQALIYRDGILFLILAVVPTIVAVVLFYTGKTAPAQSATMTLTATFHSLLAARAYRNLSDLCEKLPISMRLKVSNGTVLDADTLGRIAFMMGAPHHAEMEQGRGGHSDLMTHPRDDYGNAFAYNTSTIPNGWNSITTTTSDVKEELAATTPSPRLSIQTSRADTASNSVHIVTRQEILREEDDIHSVHSRHGFK